MRKKDFKDFIKYTAASNKQVPNKFVNWTYHSIPMTLELSRRKEEEELIELFHAEKLKRAEIINRGERYV